MSSPSLLLSPNRQSPGSLNAEVANGFDLCGHRIVQRKEWLAQFHDRQGTGGHGRYDPLHSGAHRDPVAVTGNREARGHNSGRAFTSGSIRWPGSDQVCKSHVLYWRSRDRGVGADGRRSDGRHGLGRLSFRAKRYSESKESEYSLSRGEVEAGAAIEPDEF